MFAAGSFSFVSLECGAQTRLKWRRPPATLPLDALLPIFLGGLQETKVRVARWE